jgi:hypothetical protein
MMNFTMGFGGTKLGSPVFSQRIVEHRVGDQHFLLVPGSVSRDAMTLTGVQWGCLPACSIVVELHEAEAHTHIYIYIESYLYAYIYI